jgi:phospholipase C
VVSPRAHRRAIAHEVYDHTSILRLIEWRFGLAPLTVRDAAARNLAEVLDFSGPPDTTAPRYHVPAPVTLGCLDPDHTHGGEDWPDLRTLAGQRGFAVS